MSRNQQDHKVEINVELMKYVIGYDMCNINKLRDNYHNLTITNGKRAIYIKGSSITDIEKCKNDIDTMITHAIQSKNNYNYKRRIEKELDNKRRQMQAANNIKEAIESELASKANMCAKNALLADLGMSNTPDNNSTTLTSATLTATKSSANNIKKNKFSILEIDESEGEGSEEESN